MRSPVLRVALCSGAATAAVASFAALLEVLHFYGGQPGPDLSSPRPAHVNLYQFLVAFVAFAALGWAAHRSTFAGGKLQDSWALRTPAYLWCAGGLILIVMGLVSMLDPAGIIFADDALDVRAPVTAAAASTLLAAGIAAMGCGACLFYRYRPLLQSAG